MKNIEEFIDQATTINYISGPYYGDSFDEEKFAELIIKKCIELVSTPSGLSAEYKIKNHFGIEDENKNIRIGK